MANKGDHCKYAKEFIKAGIDVYSCNSVADKISGISRVEAGKTYSIGKAIITNLELNAENGSIANYTIELQGVGKLEQVTPA